MKQYVVIPEIIENIMLIFYLTFEMRYNSFSYCFQMRKFRLMIINKTITFKKV